MKKGLRYRGFAAAVALVASGCGFESGRENLTPSADSGLPSVAVWTSLSFVQLPDPNSCGNFEWKITSQTSTSMAGDFFASCAKGSVEIVGSASGQLTSPTTVALTASGTASGSGLTCQLSLTGDGTLENSETLRVDYKAKTCVGDFQGTEYLRKPAPAPPPPPPPPPSPPPSQNPYHVGGGPPSSDRAWQIVQNTAAEFPHLTAGYPDVNQKRAHTEELLLRTIWHLQLAGYQAGRQMNPSGAISVDKLTIFLNDGRWHAYDIYTNFDVPNVQTSVIWWEVTPPNYQPNPGISD